jgi:hypothetical protein
MWVETNLDVDRLFALGRLFAFGVRASHVIRWKPSRFHLITITF